MGIGLLGTCHDLGLCGVLITKLDVVLHSGGKQDGVLGHHSHLLPEPANVEVTYIMAIYTYLVAGTNKYGNNRNV